MITQQWTVVCDNDNDDGSGRVCTASDQISGRKAQCKKERKQLGWRFVAGKSYCPDCVREGVAST